MHFTANIQNTHNSISVSETKTVFKVYGRLWMFTKIPAKFTAESLSGFLQPTDRRESRVLTHGSEAVVDINELIIKAFPDMFVVASDKTMQLKKPDGTPSDKEARIEQEYLKVVRTRELLVKLITTYRPNIHKSKIQKEVQRYIITPTYDPTDKYKEYTGWNVRQV